MKKLVLFLSITIAASAITWALKAQQIQQEKEITVKFNRNELEALYNIIDDAALPGQVRKPLLQKLATAYNAAYPQMQPKDTINKTKKN